MRALVLNADGYLGRSLAARLRAEGHELRVTVRDAGRWPALTDLGVDALDGADGRVVADAAAWAQVTYSSDGDRPHLVEQALEGVRRSAGTLIHTSGTAVFADDAAGERASAVHDEDALPVPAPRNAAKVWAEQRVLAAARSGVRAMVVRPAMTYGRGGGRQLPLLIDVARRCGAAPYVGRGTNRWSSVHIDDLGDLYLLALARGSAGAVYHGASGETTVRELAEAISRMLGLRGRTRAVSVREAVALGGSGRWWADLASNCRVSARRARRELGWAPHRPSVLYELEHGSYSAAFGASPVRDGAVTS